jgi:hypothetical protein
MTALAILDTADDIDPTDPDATTVTEELIAMRQISKRLDGLDVAARQRVMHWLTARYGEH